MAMSDPTSDGPDAYESLEMIRTEMDRLSATRAVTAEAVLTWTVEAFERTGDVDRLRQDAARFRDAYGAGFHKLWTAKGLPHFNRLLLAKNFYLETPNAGEDRWGGPWPLTDGCHVPPAKTPVVYKLLLDDQMQYIGSSINLVSRLGNHGQDKKFDHWAAFGCPTIEAARRIEIGLIDAYRPPLNRMIATPRPREVTD